jgi:hypothetical protein
VNRTSRTSRVPGGLSPLIRATVADATRPYRAWGAAEDVFGHLPAIAFAQQYALERYADTGRWPDVDQTRHRLISEAISTGGLELRATIRRHPDDVRHRAEKLIFDGWVDVELCSQIIDNLPEAKISINGTYDVRHKVDALLVTPPAWPEPCVRLAFSRRPQAALATALPYGRREQRRRDRSVADWDLHIPLAHCDFVGRAHVAFYPRHWVADQIATLERAVYRVGAMS